MTAKYHGRKRRNNRRERDRVKKALGRADETPPVDCDAVTVDGALMYIPKNPLAKDVDEPNEPTTWAEAEARAKRFRAILNKQTRAELYAETEKKWVTPTGGGTYHVYVPWPRFQKGKSPNRHSLVNPATGEWKFAEEQDAIDHKFAWYDAGYPPDWVKPKERKKPRRS